MPPSVGYAIADVATLTAIGNSDRADGYARLLLNDGNGKRFWVSYDDTATNGDYQPDDTPATGYWKKVEGAGREILTTDTTYTVRASGGDFTTIQSAVNHVCGSIDTSIHTATIDLEDSTTYTENVILYPYVGARPPVLQGDSGNIPTIASSTGSPLLINPGAEWKIQGIRLTTTGSGTDCITVEGGATLIFPNNSDVEFGPTARNHIICKGEIFADEGENGTSIAISGGSSASFGSFIRALLNARVNFSRVSVTLTNTPAFGGGVSGGFIFATQGASVDVVSGSYTGSGTGRRYRVESNAVVRSGTTLPGNTGGSTDGDGLYS